MHMQSLKNTTMTSLPIAGPSKDSQTASIAKILYFLNEILSLDKYILAEIVDIFADSKCQV